MDILVPSFAEGFQGGTVVSLLVKEGDRVAKDDVILELETEKAVGPVPSPAAGVVEKLLVQVGSSVSVGQRIARLKEESAASTPPPSAPTPPSVEKTAAPLPVASVSPAASPGGPAPVARRVPPEGIPVAAPPTLRHAAESLGLDLTLVPGSGPGGRIGWDDVRAYLVRLQAGGNPVEAAPAPPAAPSLDLERWGPVVRKPLTALRKAVADNMTLSWTTAPQVTQFDEADVTRLESLRASYAAPYEKAGVRLTLTPFLLKAMAGMLKKHPLLNTAFDGAKGEAVERSYIHLGIAVDTPQGLMVPVIRDVDQKDCATLAREVADLAARAKDRKLSLEEMRGGSMTLSNQGALGGGAFTPILRPGESAILGVARAKDRAVVRDGAVTTSRLMPLALTYDHRIVDGADAVRAVVDLVAMLEHFDEEWVKAGAKGGR